MTVRHKVTWRQEMADKTSTFSSYRIAISSTFEKPTVQSAIRNTYRRKCLQHKDLRKAK